MKSPASNTATHVYQRDVQTRANDSLSRILALIPSASVVLDVGTGSGALGRHLTRQGGFVVDGITYNTDEAALAQGHYRKLVVMDLEHEQVRQHFADVQYDVVVCADVLEHLRNAEQVLRELGTLLKPGGVLIVSLPNVTHLGVILGLLAGRFVRTREGLLDATHVHFMDRTALRSLAQASGFAVTNEDAVRRNLIDTEFARLDFQALPSAVRSYVLSLPDAEVYQFVWTLVPSTPDLADAAGRHAALAQPPAVPVIDQVPWFQAQLFLDRGNGFTEEDGAEAFGMQSEGLQTLNFPISDGAAVQALRLDFADRPGQLEFVRLVALNANGETVWTWNGDWAANQTYHQCDWTGVRGWLGGRIVRTVGDDPWVCLPLQPAQWTGVRRVELCLSSPQPMGSTDWPGLDVRRLQDGINGMSANLNVLTSQSAERIATLEAHRASAQALADFRQTDIDTLRREAAAAQQTVEAMRLELAASQHTVEALRLELAASQQAAQALRLELATSQHTVEAMRLELAASQHTVEAMRLELAASQHLAALRLEQIQGLHASRSWRVTAGLRWISRLMSPGSRH